MIASLSRSTRYFTAPLAALLCSTAVGAPVPQQGMGGAWSSGLLMENNNGPMGGGRTPYLKTGGNGAGFRPKLWKAPLGYNYSDINQPDFRKVTMEAVFPAGLVMDAHSTGNAFIPRHGGDGVPAVGDGNWLGVAVTVTKDTMGAPGSHIRAAANGANAGSHVYSYYYTESQNLAAGLSGSSILEADRGQMGLNGRPNWVVRGLDYGLGMRTVNFGEIPPLFPIGGKYYFSFTEPSTAGIAPFIYEGFANGAGTGSLLAPNGRDIYAMEWQGTGGWSDVYRYIDGEVNLNLDPLSLPDVDAIEVDDFNKTVIFSTTLGSEYLPGTNEISQLMIYQGVTAAFDPEVQPVSLKDDTGGPQPIDVTTLQGVRAGEDDDINGACGMDPGFDSWSQPASPFTGIPVATDVSFADFMGISMGAQKKGNSPIFERLLQVSGWPLNRPFDCDLEIYQCDAVAYNATLPTGELVDDEFSLTHFLANGAQMVYSTPRTARDTVFSFPNTNFDLTQASTEFYTVGVVRLGNGPIIGVTSLLLHHTSLY